MKMYVGYRKSPKGFPERCLTLYTSKGSLYYTEVKRFKVDVEERFERALAALELGVKVARLKYQTEGIQEKLVIVVSEKTVYGWVVRGESPEVYRERFARLLLELSLMSVETEVIQGKSKAKWTAVETEMAKLEKITEIY